MRASLLNRREWFLNLLHGSLHNSASFASSGGEWSDISNAK
jgi:hypothetical protein